ncbi:MAG TPA: MarR family winged helix-turn-helix transcriptional regulator [Acidimicrobiales bacterium]|nr:MarR family winged helix-turn-helix transcriptional regulator [Acidimicrobiales bacterium]
MSVRALADEQYSELLAFRTALRRFLHWSDEQARSAGLTPQQHQLLLAVRGHEGSQPTVGDVADSLLLRHHSTVELVDRAEQAGLVHRSVDDTDRRVVRLGLTAKGQRVLHKLSAAHLDELQRLAPTVVRLARDLEHQTA